MLKVTLFLVLLFAVLFVLRALRLFLASLFGRPRRRSAAGPPIEGEMVRDPVCGVWIDRRLALSAATGVAAVPVCSEACRLAAESGVERARP